MRRRDFIKGTLPVAAAAFSVNGLPVRALGRTLMTQSFTCDQINDRIMVLIQLGGGNDGFNTVIPLDQYDLYKNYRPIIGILDSGPRKYLELDNTLGVQDQVGLHPDLIGIKELYDEGKVNIVQDVSYTNNNGSHFRGTDIWLSGVDGTDPSTAPDSGWFGRYLDHRFPNYPDVYPTTEMPDPPGLEFGSHIVSLGFHRMQGIPMGLTLSNNPSAFFQDLNGVGGLLPTDIPNSDYGNELKYIIDIERSTNKYADRLAQVYEAGANSQGVVYPETYHTQTNNKYNNPLSGQLRTVARLISGGCKTKVYLVRMGGFDTHANQAIAGKPSYGGHGALLYHLSEAVRAFQNDLEAMGHEDRVVTMTFSEFGRQVKENGDWGTDHGRTAPMLVIGKGINPGVTGTNPDISDLRNNRTKGFQHDYRQIFATVLQDWLGANNGSLNHVEFYEFAGKKLDLVNSNYTDDQGNTINFVADTTCDETPDLPDPEPTSINEELLPFTVNAFPNPATEYLEVAIESDEMMAVNVDLYNTAGVLARSNKMRLFGGENKLRLEVADLEQGMYILRVIPQITTRTNKALITRKILIQN